MSHNNTKKLNILSSHCWIDSSHLSPSCNLLPVVDTDPISLKQIPPIKRRRLNGLSKLAMHTSLSCLEKTQTPADTVISVFASQHGELDRTISIVESMQQAHEVSPKDFSLSVHNASLGLFSIFSGNKLPGTSLCAGANTFGYAMLESYLLLQRFPAHQVLLTCCDLQVNPPFDQLQANHYPSYSLSLLLSLDNKAGLPIGFSFKHSPEFHAAKRPMALSFFAFLHNDINHQAINSTNTYWEFRKDV